MDYLIGITYTGQGKCGKKWMQSNKRLPKKSIPKKSTSPSRYVAVPGKIMLWIQEKGGNDIKNQLKNC